MSSNNGPQAGGQFGSHMVNALLKGGKHHITAITREGSTNKMPSGLDVKTVDYSDHSSIVSALQGHEALVITLNGRTPEETSFSLVRAAAEAKIPWILPNEWGFDTANEGILNDVDLTKTMLKVRNLISELGQSSYISVICGHLYEYSLGAGPLAYGFDFKNKAVTFYDDGKTKVNATTIPQLARAVASLLSLKVAREGTNDKSPCLEDFKNKLCYISSFATTQKAMFDSVLRVSGDKEEDWKISYEDVKQRYADGTNDMKQPGKWFPGFVKQMYARAFYPDNSSLYEVEHGLANEALELPQEDFDEFTRIAIERAEKPRGGH